MTGFDLLQALDRANPPIVIFVTARQFAIQAFDVHALDYIPSPSTTSVSIRL
jgi:DNA-binding LytR/AlgR family response regulator